MKSEAAPITDDEILLRRVHQDKFRTDKITVISPNAFEPRVKGREPDTDGISLYRAACLSDPSEVLASIAPERRHACGIVQIRVSMLKSLRLDERGKGHVVIPEFNADDYGNVKARFTPIKVELAAEASKHENILRSPSPTEQADQGG